MDFKLLLFLEAGRALGTLEPFQRLRIVRCRLCHLVVVFHLILMQMQLFVFRQIVLRFNSVIAESATERAVTSVQRDVILQRFAFRVKSSRT